MLKEEKMGIKINLSLGMDASRFKKRTCQYKKKGNYFFRDHYTCPVLVNTETLYALQFSKYLTE